MLKYILIFGFLFNLILFATPEAIEEVPNFGCKVIKVDATKKTVTLSIENFSKVVTVSIPSTMTIDYFGKNGMKNLAFSELKINTKLVISSKEIANDIKSNKIDASKIYSVSYVKALSK